MKAIFFDVDGTLYRSKDYEEHLLYEVVNVVAEFLGIRRGEAFRRLMEVKKVVKTVSRSVEVLQIDRKAFYAKLAERVKPEKYIRSSSEVVDLLKALRGRGLFVGLHTNSGSLLARKVLRCLGVSEECYDLLVTSDDAEPKPSPDGFQILLKVSGARADESLYVGDRCEVELEPAKKLGMKTAAIHIAECPFADFFLERISDVVKLF